MRNSIFGNYELVNDKIDFSNDEAQRTQRKGMIIDSVGRETGILKDTYSLTRSLDALADPSGYLNERNEAIKEILMNLSALFNKKYKFYFDRGYSHDKAYDLAMADVKEEKKQNYIDLAYKYPTRIKGNKEFKN